MTKKPMTSRSPEHGQPEKYIFKRVKVINAVTKVNTRRNVRHKGISECWGIQASSLRGMKVTQTQTKSDFPG